MHRCRVGLSAGLSADKATRLAASGVSSLSIARVVRTPLPVLFARDLEAMQAKVEAAGGTIARPIFAFPGGRRFHFRDPAGNELAVWSET